jgi:hypothetical protein
MALRWYWGLVWLVQVHAQSVVAVPRFEQSVLAVLQRPLVVFVHVRRRHSRILM